MQLINPKTISGEIMNLMDEAEKEMILVSAFYQISDWNKMIKAINDAKRRGVEFSFYVREDATDCINDLLEAGIQPKLVHRLHSKFYMNEKQGIISSMNLCRASDEGSIDIATKTTSSEEYLDLRSHFTRYILPIAKEMQEEDNNLDWLTSLEEKLSEHLDRNVHIYEDEGSIMIQTGNEYEIFIANERNNLLRLSGILSAKEFEFAQLNNIICERLKVELIEGTQNRYNTVWGTLHNVESSEITDVYPGEQILFTQQIFEFITKVEALKQKVYSKRSV